MTAFSLPYTFAFAGSVPAGIGVQLQTLRSNLRTILRQTTNTSVGVDQLPALNYALNLAQNMLYAQHEWPHLRVLKSLTTVQGQRFYSIPAGMSFDRVIGAAVYQGTMPVPMDRGISFREYARFNSEQNVQASPPRAWDLRMVSPPVVQIEIWPMPSTAGLQVEFDTLQPLGPLSADTDQAYINGDLIVLEAAVDWLLDKESPKASEIAKKRDRLKGWLLTNSQGPAKNVSPSWVRPRQPSGAIATIAR